MDSIFGISNEPKTKVGVREFVASISLVDISGDPSSKSVVHTLCLTASSQRSTDSWLPPGHLCQWLVSGWKDDWLSALV